MNTQDTVSFIDIFHDTTLLSLVLCPFVTLGLFYIKQRMQRIIVHATVFLKRHVHTCTGQDLGSILPALPGPVMFDPDCHQDAGAGGWDSIVLTLACCACEAQPQVVVAVVGRVPVAIR